MQQGVVSGRRRANERVRELVDAFGDEQRERHDWVFFCECGDPLCEEMVHLSPSVFDSIAGSDDGRVLADGHPLTRSRATRRRSADLRESAQALRGQAGQASRRAKGLRHTIGFRFELSHGEMLDAAEDLERLQYECEELDLAPSCIDLLHALEEAIVEASLPSSRPYSSKAAGLSTPRASRPRNQ